MVAKILLVILQKAPAYQRLLHIQLDATGQPGNSEAFTRLAQEYVVVRIKEVAEQAA